MLYTFSKSVYLESELTAYLQQAKNDDAIVLWQDGVYLMLKYPQAFLHLNAPCYVLDLDIDARNLSHVVSTMPQLTSLSLAELVKLTEIHTPQFAL
ncbi:DsrH/TusB family sulfur relay protein [Pasteurella sp. PK-2025]|uniref:DsrH/TusB family sulfur relay protein n=1 Tax=Pasteurella sp. PK-2025 TaxID=3413133 RepID=UPI003C71AFBA